MGTALRILRTYALCILAWTFIGAFFLSQDVIRRMYFGDTMPWREVPYWLVRALMCAALTPLILWLGDRWPIKRQGWFPRVSLHLFCSVCCAPIAVALETSLLTQLGALPSLSLQNDFRSAFPVLMLFGFHAFVLVYWLVLALQSGLCYYRKYQERAQHALRMELHASELKAQMVNAQLSALKMQLQPHFLFNTLNAVVVLVRQQKGQQAEETLGRFSDLLRCVLSDIDAQEVPLSRELEYLRLYLAIEQVRFSDRLRVELHVDTAVLEAAVPHMSLQPLVENAVRHGIGRSATGGAIEIRAERVNDTLEIRVSDDGAGFSDTRLSNGSGMGLSNTRARLRQLYAEAAKLQIASVERGGTVVTMVLPYHIREDNQ